MKVNKVENLVWIIFTIIGAIFFIVGVGICLNVLNKEDKVETVGVITEMAPYRSGNSDTSYHVWVAYQVEGKEYESKLNGYSSDFYKGKEIEIYYEKNNPSKIGVKSLDLLVLIFPGMGFLFMTIGGIGIFVKLNKKRRKEQLKEKGELIYANYTETILNRAYTVNGRNPYNIICEWNNPSDSKKYLFRSENIWINPEDIIQERNIKTFPVYINPNKIEHYFIDVGEIEQDVVDLR